MKRDVTMKIPVMKSVAGLWQRRNSAVVVAALLAAGALGGASMPAALVTEASAIEPPSEVSHRGGLHRLPLEANKAKLVGSYEVDGTDSDGKPYVGLHILDISLAPSGALELDWDNGKQVGVGQVIGNVLAVACLSRGRTVILTMTLNPDGSFSGKWSRRTDRGSQGTETWKRT
jgi:hypothetical protein